MSTEAERIEVPFNRVRVDGTIYKIKHMKDVGFYVDDHLKATSGPTIEELMAELKRRYEDVRPA
jgi:hypothetical protein